ncbi:replication factor C subunit 2/4 [Paragonimus westermani]|uniref:Replication factor C subunit 2/4 n=1 Tax=Paragonimus westermani TaxID=34504 RepID=A0A5J4N9K3_9TREM|nr:replication factor C subunit 2/4 [Paragonimus westermani]
MDTFLSAFKRKVDSPSLRKPKSQSHIPWVEKYRPKTIDDVAHQTEVVSVMRKCVEGADLPNLLFYGPPGTGKTSLIMAVARQIFGSLYSERVLELNASDERGIDVIRQKVKTFAHLAVAARSSGVSGTGSIPPYKLIILDEADSMTAPAQAALRRTMETETRTTRFCLTCNYVTRIIDPITSRCAKFRFRPLDNEVARGRLRHICDAEGLKVSDEVLDHVLQLSHGDLRRGITMLQSVCQLWNPSAQVNGAHISKEQLDDVAAVIPTGMITGLVEAAQSGRFDDVQAQIKAILLEGHSAHQAIYQLHSLTIESDSLTDKRKAPLLETFALADSRLMDGADEYLQLLYVGGGLMKAFA